ncbi:MAG: transposase [Acidobacteriota bacterium]
MPRPPRVFVEGGIYHVYNRVTRGERVFEEKQEAALLLEAMREIRDRDGLIVLAWCIMGHHYHLAVRCGGVPLWRSMAGIHTKISKSYNVRHRFYGPFWQGRYRAKLVETPDYLRQLLLYIHLNPVSAGLVEKPEEYVWSGHRELVRRFKKPFINPDQLLLAFGETRRAARKSYLASIRANREETWMNGLPGELPWWRLGRPRKEETGDELRMDPATPFIDELGRSTALERPWLKAEDFIQRALDALEISSEEVSGRTKRQEVVRAREILMTLGVERYGLRVTRLAAVLGVRYNSASLWGRRGATRRMEDRAFAGWMDEIDAIIASSPPSKMELVD